MEDFALKTSLGEPYPMAQRSGAIHARHFFVGYISLCLMALLLGGCASMDHSAGGGPKPSALSIANTSLPVGQVGQSYSAALTASGGTIPYSWSVSSGTLPAGLTLDPASGLITGKPTETRAANVTFAVADSGNPVQRKTISLSFNISPATTLAITTTSLPNGEVGAAYSATLAATGGAAPYTWSVTSGALPAW